MLFLVFEQGESFAVFYFKLEVYSILKRHQICTVGLAEHAKHRWREDGSDKLTVRYDFRSEEFLFIVKNFICVIESVFGNNSWCVADPFQSLGMPIKLQSYAKLFDCHRCGRRISKVNDE